MVTHLAAIGVDAGEVLMIGDAADDALAARHVGADAVLFTGGYESRAALEAVGVPVVDTLTDALRYTSGRIG
ncbi:MAG: HAD hydrolase-like protein [Streptosporangiales bacterium]|nr:HAD hydrolase-like protein [Streptosporangiales bacterium]